MNQRIVLHDFSDLFEERIYRRAQEYHDAGRVGRIVQVAPGLWHAKVAGSTDPYDVDVSIRQGQVVSASCTCPYARRHTYCKHVGALLLSLAAQEDAPSAPRWAIPLATGVIGCLIGVLATCAALGMHTRPCTR